MALEVYKNMSIPGGSQENSGPVFKPQYHNIVCKCSFETLSFPIAHITLFLFLFIILSNLKFSRQIRMYLIESIFALGLHY